MPRTGLCPRRSHLAEPEELQLSNITWLNQLQERSPTSAPRLLLPSGPAAAAPIPQNFCLRNTSARQPISERMTVGQNGETADNKQPSYKQTGQIDKGMVPENAEFGASRCCEANCCAQGPDAPACYRGSWSAGEPAAPHRSIAGNDDESIDCSEYCCAPPLTAEEYHSLNNISILFNNIKDDERSNSMLAEDDAQAFHGQDNAGGQGAINGAEDINYWNSDALTARPHSPNTTNAHANAHAAVRADSCMGRSARQPSSPIISPASSPIQQSTCNYSPVMPNCSPVFKAMKSNSEASPGVARAYSATTSPRDDGIRKGRFVIRPAAEQSTGVSTLQYRRGRFQITEAVDHDAGSAAVSKKLLTILSLQNKQLDILFDMIKNIAGNDKLFQREFTQLSDDVYELTECLKKKINM